MKRALLIPLIIIFLVSVACNLFSNTSAELSPSQQATDEIVQPTAPDDRVTPTQPEPSTSPTEPPVDISTPTASAPGPMKFEDTFEKSDASWADPFIVTSQAVGNDPLVQIKVALGVMRFNIQDKETYVYRYFSQPVSGVQGIQVNYEPRGSMVNGVAVICRADQEHKTWFEMRLTPENSKYNFYRYDSQLKEMGKNPYLLLGQGVLAVKDFPPAKENSFSLTCNEEELKLDINQGKRVITQPLESGLPGNYVGIGVMSYNEVPVTIDFKTITIQNSN